MNRRKLFARALGAVAAAVAGPALALKAPEPQALVPSPTRNLASGVEVADAWATFYSHTGYGITNSISSIRPGDLVFVQDAGGVVPCDWGDGRAFGFARGNYTGAALTAEVEMR